MIIVKIHAGLGNQMFQYATGLRLARFRKTELKLDISAYSQMAAIDTPRKYDLDQYKILAAIATKQDLDRILPTDWSPNMAFRVKRRLGLDQRIRPLGEPSKSFYNVVLRARDNTYLTGWWQNEKYFRDIRSVLLEEFVPKKLSPYSKKILDDIKSSPSISLHVRRSDYVSNKYAAKEHGAMDVGYYKAGTNLLKKMVKDPRFFVFSDDIEWCRKNLKLGEMVFVEDKARQASEDIYLMQHCLHNMVANSSFSWWGGWLNDHPNKMVIAPKRWFLNEESNRETEVVPKSWVRL